MNALRHRAALVLLVLVAAALFALPFGCDAARAPTHRPRPMPRPDTTNRPHEATVATAKHPAGSSGIEGVHCPVCARAGRLSAMKPGVASAVVHVSSPDFLSDRPGDPGQTRNAVATGRLIPCAKCPTCGYSTT